MQVEFVMSVIKTLKLGLFAAAASKSRCTVVAIIAGGVLKQHAKS